MKANQDIHFTGLTKDGILDPGTRSFISKYLISVPGHAAAGTRVFLEGTSGTFSTKNLNS
jgi:hypothetical protein